MKMTQDSFFGKWIKRNDDKYLAKWNVIRRQGMGRYIIVRWIICYSIPISILIVIINPPSSGGSYAPEIYYCTILMLMLGLFLGWLAWRRTETRWQKLQRGDQGQTLHEKTRTGKPAAPNVGV